MRWRREKPLTCREAVELVTDYLEDALPPRERDRFEQHLALGDPCVEYVEQVRTAVALAHRVPPDAVDPVTMRQMIALYRAWQQPG